MYCFVSFENCGPILSRTNALGGERVAKEKEQRNLFPVVYWRGREGGIYIPSCYRGRGYCLYKMCTCLSIRTHVYSNVCTLSSTY